MTEIKRRAKRLFAGLLGLLMALSLLSTTAFADANTTITINKPDTIDADWTGMTVTAYQVLAASEDAGTYKVHQDFAAFFDINNVKALFGDNDTVEGNDNTTVFLTYDEINNHLTASASSTNSGNEITITSTDALDTKYPEADLISRIDDNNGSTEAKNGGISVLYTWLEKYIESKESFTQTLMTKTADTGTDSLSVDVGTKGYYALIFSNVPSSISTIQGILVKTADGGTAIDLKAEQLPLNKQVINPDHQTQGEKFDENLSSTANKDTSADIGDTLKYQILTKVPTLADTENLTVFALSDTLKNQQLNGTMTLTLSKADVEDVVFTASLPTQEDPNPYFVDSTDSTKQKKIAKLTVTEYANKAQSFEVNFLPTVGTTPDLTPDPKITVDLTDYQGYDVKLTYTAVLTADAQQVNGNDVTLDYTNNDSESEQTDHTDVYTYGIEVQKKFSDGSNHYGDVNFSLYTDAEYKLGDSKTALNLYGSDGSYKMVGTTTPTTILGLNTDTGKLTITGLDAGTYWLVETGTANGYSVSDDIKIVLVADAEDKKMLDENNTTAQLGGTGDDLANVDNSTGNISLAKFDVLNQKGFNLPQTGGAGTWMFTIGGILLVAAAGVLFALSRKKDGSK